MKSGICRFVEQNLWQYIDRELSARKVGEISAHLKGCSTCGKVYEDRAREATMYRLAFMSSPFGERFEERFGEHLAELEEDLLAEPERQNAPLAVRIGELLRERRVAFALASVFVVLLIVTSFTFAKFREVREAQIAQRRSPPSRSEASTTKPRKALTLGSITRGDDAVPGNRSTPVYAGRSYASTSRRSEARLKLDDGSMMTFDADRPWSCMVLNDSRVDGPFVAEVYEGRVSVNVTPRSAARHFTLFTPTAEIRVVGTAFSVEVENGNTALLLFEGSVRLTDLTSNETRLLEGGKKERVRVPFEREAGAGGVRAPEPRESDSLDSPAESRR